MTHNPQEGLYVSSGLGLPWGAPVGAGGCSWDDDIVYLPSYLKQAASTGGWTMEMAGNVSKSTLIVMSFKPSSECGSTLCWKV